MANVTIVKLKVRRGSDAQRKTIILDQGEVGYTLDTRRLFVGDGSTEGGHVIGNKGVGPFTNIASLGQGVGESPGLQLGDIGYADSRLYMLTSTTYDDTLGGWAYIGNKPDGTFIDTVGGSGTDKNFLTLKKNPGAIDSQYMAPAVFGQGLLSSYDASIGGKVEVGLNTSYLELSTSGSDKVIAIRQDGITEREISSNALLSGLQGGDVNPEGGFNKVSLKVNTSQFGFDSNNRLEFKSLGNLADGGAISIPTTNWAGAGGNNLGGGLSLDTSNKLQANVRGVATGSRINLANGELSLNGAVSSAQEFPFFLTQQGLITEIQSSVFDVVTATGLSGDNAGDGVPIGSILPHAQAFTTIPAGYLLCDGTDVSRTTYNKLFDVIGTSYGNRAGDTFTLPNLTAGNTFMYGASGGAPDAFQYVLPSPAALSGANTLTRMTDFTNPDGTSGGASNVLSGFGFNFIIKAKEDPLMNIFNGAPNQVTNGYLGTTPDYSQQVYECLDSTGARTTLSSAGFIRFGLSGLSRDTEEKFDKFAIPVFNW